MLQHMPFRSPADGSNEFLDNNLIICQTIACYDLKAFDENIYLKRIKKNNPEVVEFLKNKVSEL